MNNLAKHLSAGYYSITPYLVIHGAAEAIEYYQWAFGAEELMRMTDPNGKVRHAEIRIGDSVIMMADEFSEYPMMRSPRTLGGAPVHLYLYVLDADAVFQQAVDAGAQVLMPVENQGEDRRGGLTDPFGHIWWIATRIEDVPRAEIQRRFETTQGRQ